MKVETDKYTKSIQLQYYLCLMFFTTLIILYDVMNVVQAKQDQTDKHMMKQ